MQQGGAGDTASHHGRYVVGVIVCAAIAAFWLLACLGGVIVAAGSASARTQSGTSFGGDITLAVVAALLALVFILLAVHLEHRVRHQHPAAQAWAAGPPPRLHQVTRRRYSPGMLAFQCVVFAAMFAGFLIGSVLIHGEGSRSSRVQHHGIEAVATVTAVHSTFHSTRSGGYYSSDIDATIAPPVQGQTTTVIHYPGRISSGIGNSYRVLLDPHNPGYSELPGTPATSNSSWIIALCFAIVFGVLDVFFIRVRYRMWRQARTVAASAVGASHPLAT